MVVCMKKTPKKSPPIATAKTISLRVQPNILAELDALAKKSGMARSSIIQMAIVRLLKTGL
jgi:predicted transcriptional regulator